MASIPFRSPVRVPLLRFGAPKPTPPDPRAYDTFRVTQRYDDPDSINPMVLHRAVDIGNFRCGDTLVAMAPGVAYRVKDNAKAARGAPSDALGIRIDHGHGVTSETWHVSQWLVEHGSKVNAGQPIASVGNTGLGSVCHAHIEIKVNGIRIDPEPMIFGLPLTVDGDDMKLPAAQGYFATGVVGAGVNVRDPNTLDDPTELATETTIRLIGFQPGRKEYTVSINGTPRTDSDWYMGVLSDDRTVAVAKLLVRDIAPTRWLHSQIPLPDADDGRVTAALPHISRGIGDIRDGIAALVNGVRELEQ